jgi:hypothetical protein
MKPFLTCAFFCFATCLFAQIPKGKIMSEVGLNYTLSQQRDDFNVLIVGGASTTQVSNFSIFSTNRYFIKTNVYVSLGVEFSNSFSSNSFSSNSTSKYDISLGLGALRSIGSKFYLGTDLNVGLSKNFYTDDNNRKNVNTNSFKQYFLNIKPQLYYHVHPKFLLFTGFGQVEYNYSSYFTNGYTFKNTFRLDLSPRFWNYGFIFLWGKSKEKT